MYTEQKYMTYAMFDGTMNRITEIRSMVWNVLGDETDPLQVQLIVETDIGTVMFICPHPWKMDEQDLYIQGLACGILLNKALQVLGLDAEEFISPIADPGASLQQITSAVNRIIAVTKKHHTPGSNQVEPV